jgi:nucleotide-binding universal stress UspA family protein
VFHHILLATDFSEASERALELAAGLGAAHRARVTVLHVYPSYDAKMPEVAVASARKWPGVVRAQAKIDWIVERLRARGLKAEGALRFGILPERIADVARELGADVIVTGTRARKGLAHWWYGSIVEELLRESRVPVLAAVEHDRDDLPLERDNVIQLRRP